MFEHNSKQDPETFEDPAELDRQLQNMIEEGGGRVMGLTIPRVEHGGTHPRIEDLVEEQAEQQAA